MSDSAERAGKWKFCPWAERKTGRGAPKGRKPSSEPVQLYDVNSDIGETKNLAAEYPNVVKKLKAIYQDHVKEIKANRRPTAKLHRPEGKPSAARP